MAKKQSGTISKRMQKRAEQRRKKRMTQIVVGIVALVIIVGGAWAIFGNVGAGTEVAQDSQTLENEVEEASLPLEINVDEAYERYQAGDFLLDVRTQEEWDEYHIPGTTLIPLDELGARVDEVPADQNVVVVCRSGNRSQAGRDTLRDAGYTQVTSMDGGVSTWRDAGYPVE
jgi:rhodanese-related sulfurtransferase